MGFVSVFKTGSSFYFDFELEEIKENVFASVREESREKNISTGSFVNQLSF
jgi:hypothetical protein